MLNYKNNNSSGSCNTKYSCNNSCCSHCCPGVVCTPVPTGPAGAKNLGGMHAQLDNAARMLAENNENVFFNIILNEPGCEILYEQNTGEFILPPRKNYYVSWWAAINGTGFTETVDFAVAIDNQPIAISSSPLVTCQLSGAALVTAGRQPTALSLKNVSGDRVRYAATSVQVNIVIFELSS